MQSDPYCLARDIHGIGFKTADLIAQRIGIPPDSVIRACAGLSHVLLEATAEGHCALPMDLLKEQAARLLETPDEIIACAIEKTLGNGDLVAENIAGANLAYLPHLRQAELDIAARIARLAAAPPTYPPINIDKAVAWRQRRSGKVLAPSQEAALRVALSSRVLILTGGPGVGKTTLLHSILLILQAKDLVCLLAAPTGRAAKRLTETTGLEAKTIHRLLEFNPPAAALPATANPLDCDLLVVDEDLDGGCIAHGQLAPRPATQGQPPACWRH